MELWSQSYNSPTMSHFGIGHFGTSHFDTSHFGVSHFETSHLLPQTPKTEPQIQPGVLSASDALQKIQRRRRPSRQR